MVAVLLPAKESPKVLVTRPGGGGFFLLFMKIPGRAGVPGRTRRVPAANWEFVEWWGAKYFFSGRNVHQDNEFRN